MLVTCPVCKALYRTTNEMANSPYQSERCCSKKCLSEYNRKSFEVVNENCDEDADY